jgi:hypothetical protein
MQLADIAKKVNDLEKLSLDISASADKLIQEVKAIKAAKPVVSIQGWSKLAEKLKADDSLQKAIIAVEKKGNIAAVEEFLKKNAKEKTISPLLKQMEALLKEDDALAKQISVLEKEVKSGVAKVKAADAAVSLLIK